MCRLRQDVGHTSPLDRDSPAHTCAVFPRVVRVASLDILGHGKKGEFVSESPFPEIAHPPKRAFLAAFRETGNVGGALASIDLTQLSDEQLARISAGENPFSVLASTPGRSQRECCRPGRTLDRDDAAHNRFDQQSP